MALHICRDYLVQGASASKSPSAFVLSIFLRRTMGWSFVGQTNFDINSAPASTTITAASNNVALPTATINVVSTAGFPSSGNLAITTTTGVQYVIYTGTTATTFTGCSQGGGTMNTGGIVTTMLVATGDTSPAGSPTFPAGNKAGINNVAGVHVTIPSSVRTVTAADVGRMIVLKSTTNPTFNSGVFLITAIDTTSGRNDYVVNWRSGDAAPVEAADSLQWWLYAADAAAPIVQGPANAGTGYRSNGTATTPRIVLQSPHSTAWQLRICCESVTDYNTGNNAVPQVSIAPGFNGNSAGDFLVGGRNLHGPLWHDSTSSVYAGLVPGIVDISSNQYRLTFQADDGGQAVVGFGRNAAFSQHWMIVFGIPESEPLPVPTDPLLRLFTLGGSRGVQNGITYANGQVGSSDVMNGGSAYGLSSQPISCTTGCWAYSSGPVQGSTPFADVTAGDSPYIGSTELVTVEVVAGAFQSYTPTFTFVIPQEPRLMGIIPFLRQGRTNFGLFTLSTDAGKAWQHMRNGVYMPWGGPAVLP